MAVPDKSTKLKKLVGFGLGQSCLKKCKNNANHYHAV